MVFKFIAFYALLGASFLLCRCLGRDSATELDPMIVLSNYLLSTGKLLDFDASIAALKRLNANSELDDKPDVKALLISILKLCPANDGQFCGAPNLSNMNSVARVVFSQEKKLPQNLQLSNLLGNYIDKAREECLGLLESQFGDSAVHLSKEYNTLTALEELYLYLDLERRLHIRDSDLLTNLQGALTYQRSKRVPPEYALRSLLDEMSCHLDSQHDDSRPCGVKINEKTGDQDDLTLDEAKSHLDRLVLKPCQSLLDNDKVKMVLGRVVDLSEAILNRNVAHKLDKLDKDYKTLEWAHLTVMCKWFLARGKQEFAAKLTSSVKYHSFGGSDPVSRLNNYLVDHLESNWDINANFRVVRDLVSTRLEPKRKAREAIKFEELVSRLSLINDDDFCAGQNMKNLRATMEAVVGYRQDSFEIPLKRRRLNYLLKKYTQEAKSRCLEAEFEPAFNETAQTIADDYKLVEKLDPICRIWAFRSKPIDVTRSDLTRLIGAADFPYKVQTFWSAAFAKKLRDAIYKMQQDDGSEAGTIRLDEKSLTFEEAKSYLKEHFYDKCGSFIDNKSVKGILKRAADLGVAISYANVSSKLKHSHYTTLEWASRLVACEWFHDKGLDKFAALLVGKRTWNLF